MSVQHILQVSELTKKVRFLLESELNTLWLTGEISNLVCASSGHWYLSLKDSQSQVRCAMFKAQNARVRIRPKNGQQVLVKAKVSLYEPRGDFQLILEQMDDAGTGLLQQKYQALKQQLTTQGLFDVNKKQALPKHIYRLGIVTSATGAALRDILTVLKRRNPSMQVIIYPSLVQGELAAANICQAIAIANQRQECDVLMVARGGGSLEDLWCFNEQSVVRAIAASRLPIISAVGHETDTTLADYASDLRAATPSAGAELVSNDRQELLGQLKQQQHRLTSHLQNQIKLSAHGLTALQHRLNRLHPERQFQLQQQRHDDLTAKLQHAMAQLFLRQQQAQQQLVQRLIRSPWRSQIGLLTKQSTNLQHQLQQAIQLRYQQKAMSFAHLVEQLQLVSPLSTIARGYAVVRDQQQQIIRSTEQLAPQQKISIQLTDGIVNAQVID
jgi:exodeoxyribonuclease VII large subunit